MRTRLKRRAGQQLTAAEAADQVAARWRARRDRDEVVDLDPDEPGYRCEQCGSEEFLVEQTYLLVVTWDETLECTCEESNVDNAATITHRTWNYLVEWGPLLADHDFEMYDHEVWDEDIEEVAETITCQDCFDEADQYAWAHDEHADESETSDLEFSVYCTSCGHEVEFGWSHPDRGGRVWPCEAADFNPWKCWPEPRFADAWAARGWLRPLMTAVAPRSSRTPSKRRSRRAARPRGRESRGEIR